MCLDIGEKTTPLEIVASQVKYILDQERDQVPAQHLKIRCVCLKLVRWVYMHRCLYCSVFYCKECAEQHFGKTVDQYRAEEAMNPITEVSQ